MNHKVMTAQHAFNVAINLHPILYSSDTLDDAKFKYFDHIFNVLGNGYRDLNEFIDGHWIGEHNEHLLASFPSKYIGSQPLYTVYTKARKIGNIAIPEYDSAIDGLYTESELTELDDVATTVQANLKFSSEPPFPVPYPNFIKDYSMVWRMDMSKLDSSWTQAAIWYYEKVREFFNSDKTSYYHGALPTDIKQKSRLISDYEKNFERYNKDGMTQDEFFAAISENYELTYDGNTEEFIIARWNKELERINLFIDETIDMLKNQQSLNS